MTHSRKYSRSPWQLAGCTAIKRPAKRDGL